MPGCLVLTCGTSSISFSGAALCALRTVLRVIYSLLSCQSQAVSFVLTSRK